VETLYVTAELFATLGRRAAVGRVFTPAEDRPGAEPVLVLSHGYWQRRFGGDAGVVGRTLVADGKAHAIVGVLPPDFAFGEAELYAPLALDPADAVTSRGAHNYLAVARLAPGATHAQLAAQLDALTARLRRDHPASYPPGMRFAVYALPLHEALVGDARGALRVLAGAVALLCSSPARTRRTCCSRAARGGGASSACTPRSAPAAGASCDSCSPRARCSPWARAPSASRSARRWCARCSPCTPTRCRAPTPCASTRRRRRGAAPLAAHRGAVRDRAGAARGARRRARAAARRRRARGTARTRDGLRRALVVGELALAVVVVTAAGLLTRSFRALQGVDAGLDPRGVLTMATSLPSSRYPDERVAPTYDALLDRVRALPGVEAAGAVGLLPLAGREWNWDVIVEGRPRAPGAPAPSPRPQVATPGALDALGATVVRGRGILPADRADAPLVALVNETMARTVWPGADALGRRFRMDGDSTRWATVVGVVRDVRVMGLGEPAVPEFYVPLAQFLPFARWQLRGLTVLARTAGTRPRLAPPVRRALADVDPTLAASDVRTMRQVVDRSVARPRFTMLLLSAFGARRCCSPRWRVRGGGLRRGGAHARVRDPQRARRAAGRRAAARRRAGGRAGGGRRGARRRRRAGGDARAARAALRGERHRPRSPSPRSRCSSRRGRLASVGPARRAMRAAAHGGAAGGLTGRGASGGRRVAFPGAAPCSPQLLSDAPPRSVRALRRPRRGAGDRRPSRSPARRARARCSSTCWPRRSTLGPLHHPGHVRHQAAAAGGAGFEGVGAVAAAARG
jgi:hypothetical protein